MTSAQRPDRTHLLESTVKVPQHVVYRAFVNETVLLNLETGQYHSVNPTGAAMLQTLEKVSTVAEAAQQLATQYDRPLDEIQTDLCDFCDELLARRLIELNSAA